MKTQFILCATLATLALDISLLTGHAAAADAVTTNVVTSATNAVASATNAVTTATNTVPQSVFAIPANKKEGRDPFFPTSTRLWGMTVVATAPKQAKATGIDCLVLKGLSGAPANPLAMINSRTMARGEDAEITTDCGRLLVHCVDITTNAAIIEVSGERREIHLRSDF